MRPRSKARQPRQLRAVLGRFQESLAPSTLLALAQSAWASSVGETIAANTELTREKGGVLTVRCKSSVWASELTLMGASLCVQLNESLPEGRHVEALKFVVGPH